MRKRLIENSIKLKEETKKIIITVNKPELSRKDIEQYVNSVKNGDTPFQFKPLSHSIDTSKSYSQQNKNTSLDDLTYKPEGLWYAYDHSWIDFLKINSYINEYGVSNLSESSKSIFNVNAVIIGELDNSNILKLNTVSDLQRLYSKYKLLRDFIDWESLSKNYNGIEILKPLINERGITLPHVWEIASGCIWKELNKIKIKEIIPLVQYMNEYYSESNYDENNYDKEDYQYEDEYYKENDDEDNTDKKYFYVQLLIEENEEDNEQEGDNGDSDDEDDFKPIA
jgi:hypothetical protein